MKRFTALIVTLAMLFSIGIVCRAEGEEAVLITRGELADAVMDADEYITQQFSFPMAERPTFSDVAGNGGMRILQAYLHGYMNGMGEGKFAPLEPVPRVQMAMVAYRLLQRMNEKYAITQSVDAVDIRDIDAVPEWAVEAVTYMVSVGLIELEGENFYPDKLVTVSEAGKILDAIKVIFVANDDGSRITYEEFLESRKF